MTHETTSEPFARINTQEAREKIESGNARAIDVRMAFDYAGGRIPGSLNLPNLSIRFRKSEVPEDKALLFISEDGELSAQVCRLAVSLGFYDVYNLEGGISAWTEAGFPIETISEGGV